MSESPSAEGLKMSQVAKMTGVGAHTLRVWERRYGVPAPERSEGRQRLYSMRDVEVVRRMRDLSNGGVALATAARTALAEAPAEAGPGSLAPSYAALLSGLLDFDERAALEAWRSLLEGTDVVELLSGYVGPLLTDVGERWHAGEVSVAQEHFASTFLRGRLEQIHRQLLPPAGAPAIVLACPPGERHELPLLMLTILLRLRGLRTVFLGADLPQADLLRTVEDIQPAAVALSVTTDESAATLPDLARALREACPGSTLVVGGLAIDSGEVMPVLEGAVYGGPSLIEAAARIAAIAHH